MLARPRSERSRSTTVAGSQIRRSPRSVWDASRPLPQRNPINDYRRRCPRRSRRRCPRRSLRRCPRRSLRRCLRHCPRRSAAIARRRCPPPPPDPPPIRRRPIRRPAARSATARSAAARAAATCPPPPPEPPPPELAALATPPVAPPPPGPPLGRPSGSSEPGRVPRLLAEKRQKDWRQARGRPPVRMSSWLKVARRDTPMRLILKFSRSPSCNLCWSDP